MLLPFILTTAFLPEVPVDSLISESDHTLDEVVVISLPSDGRKRADKGQAASIDEHLSQLNHVGLVRRGAYAWEPTVNNMQSERVATTIDGMKIFYACTDKMDPVTSYVESGNLQSISLNSGLDGNPQATGNIGGSLDLKLRKAGFDADPFRLSLNAGHEWNGHLQVYGADAAWSTSRFYANAGLFYRHADDYTTGKGVKLPFSQFQKVNTFTNLGIKITESDVAEVTLIFDKATNVGYPALNMDVAKAEGFISSLSYRHLFTKATWETKAYYNHITHEMDDTKRPDVQIHMDMPGKSWTAGIYSLLTTSQGKHDFSANYDLYYNRLFADMTMYPGGAAPMYMVTWPDVGTLNTGVALKDKIWFSENQSLSLSAKLAWQQQRLNDQEGYHALQVFFPGMTDSYHQTTGRIAVNYSHSFANLTVSAGAGWGSRAPTVTEAYGYYLNNTFDQYDYIGNPHLKNESALELNAELKWKPADNLTLTTDANVFLFSNYIIGQFENRLSPMTVGAEGVKVYGNIPHATIANFSLRTEWKVTRWLDWRNVFAYAIGRDAAHDPLPLISPFDYSSVLSVSLAKWQGNIEVKGNARQTNYGRKYGEKAASAWAVCNLNVQRGFSFFTVRAGVENLFDRRYSTYADWNHIPQKGRNIFMNLTFDL
mgnify:CR=1 FL=1